jgi:hypothetical protein
MFLRVLSTAACTFLLATVSIAQMGDMKPNPAAPLPSPPAVANVTLAGGTVTINYNTPHMRGRKIMGDLVPYNQVWRTGANPATSLYTPIPLHIGSVLVPAGKYTIYTLPAPGKWMLIINKHTGQWGTEYYPAEDLARIPMKEQKISTPQEVMSISFENTKDTQTELHVKWESTDVSVKVTTP